MKRRYKYPLLIFAGIWVVGMVALAPGFIQIHREEKAVRQLFADFGSALVTHQFETAYNSCGPEFRAEVSFEKFVALNNDFETNHGTLISVKEAGYDIKGEGTPTHWRAVFGADFQFKGSTIRFMIEFHKENDKWVLFGMRQV